MIGAGDIGKSVHEDGTFDQLAGIAPRAITELFQVLDDRRAQMTFVVEVQVSKWGREACVVEARQVCGSEALASFLSVCFFAVECVG